MSFLGKLFGGSKSSSSTSSTVNDSKQAADNGSFVNRNGTLVVTDHGAVKSANDATKNAIDKVSELASINATAVNAIAGRALDANSDVVSDGFSFGSNVFEGALITLNDNHEKTVELLSNNNAEVYKAFDVALDSVSDATRSDIIEPLQRLIMWGGIAITAYALVRLRT